MNGATSRSDYVALIGRSYLEAVREVNEVKDVAQEEARRQNGGVLPARFQLSPLHQEQIRVIASSFIDVLQFASAFEIEAAEITHIIQGLDEQLARSSRRPGRVDTSARLQSPAFSTVVQQVVTSTQNEQGRSNVPASSARRDVPTPAVAEPASTTDPESQQSASKYVNSIGHRNGMDFVSRRISVPGMPSDQRPHSSSASASSRRLSEQPSPVANTIANFDIQTDDDRDDSGSSVTTTVAAATSMENLLGEAHQRISTSDANEFGDSGDAVPQPPESDSPDLVARPLSTTVDLLPSHTDKPSFSASSTDKTSSSTPAQLPQFTVLAQPEPSLPILPPPPPLLKAPSNTAHSSVSSLPSTLSESSLTSSDPRIAQPILSRSSGPNTINGALTQSALPSSTVPEASTSDASSSLPFASAAVPSPSLRPIQQGTGLNVVSPQVRQQALANGTSPIPRTSSAMPASVSIAHSIPKSYKHSKLAIKNVRRVIVGSNGIVTGRLSSSSNSSDKPAGKQLPRPTLSTFNSNMHSDAQTAARARILQAQKEMLAQAISALQQPAESAVLQIEAAPAAAPAAPRKMSANDNASHPSKLHRIPPLPEWLIGHSSRKRGDSSAPPLPVWAYEPEYDAPDATYASKRRRMHAPEPEWYGTVAATRAVVAGAYHRDLIKRPIQRQSSTPEIHPPDICTSENAIPIDRGTKKVKRAEDVEAMDIDIPLDLSPPLACSPEKSPCISRSDPPSPVSRPISSSANCDTSRQDDISTSTQVADTGAPSEAPAPVIHEIPEGFTNKDITKWQRKVWRLCFCEWPGCGAILNDWESLEKHILLAHVTRQRPRPNPNSVTSVAIPPPAPTLSGFVRAQMQNGRRPPLQLSATSWKVRDQRSTTDEDDDPIALHPGTSRTRGNQIKLILKPPGYRNTFAENRAPVETQPEKVWLPFVCLYGDCIYKPAANAAYVSTDALKRHFQNSHLDVNFNKGFPCCVVKACPYNFSEAFGSIAQSHKHVRTHPPAVLANMQYAKDTPNTIPGSSLIPVPEKVPEYLIIDPPVRNGPKAPPEALIHALADTQDSWDSQADMTFRTAFGFVPVSHSEAALEGAPIPPYDMYAQGTPSDTRSLFNPVPEYTLCTPRHPASHKSWKRLPVKMQLVPKRRHEKIATPWCNLSDLSRRDDEKIKLIISRDTEKAIQQQKKKGPRKVALEDPEEVPEGLEREWPTRETIGPWHYLEDMS